MEVAKVDDSQSINQLSADPPVQATENEETEVAPEFLIKHPLQNVWKLWYYENVKGRDWEENLKCITSFDTAEDFWSIYHHIKQASEIKQGCDYCIFKDGITPKWEHAANEHGGRWLITLEKKHRYNDLDRIWLEVCMCLIGEGFENSDDVNGAVLNIRGKQDKIAIWLGDYSKTAAVLEIGKKIKEKLKLGQRFQIAFQLHSDVSKPTSTIKAKFTV